MKKLVLNNKEIHRGSLILVNTKCPYIETGCVLNAIDGTEIKLEMSALKLLNMLMEKINGWDQIVAVSGWRSIEEQIEIYNASIIANGEGYTQKYVAIPGCSEHHTGLAIDLALNSEEIDFICPEFGSEGVCKNFREQMALYGFILRYPLGKESITGISYEPWHFRYVGVPHAAIMNEKEMVLEEYIEFLKRFLYGERNFVYAIDDKTVVISYVPAVHNSGAEILIDDTNPYCISGNNEDGFIITEWRQHDDA